MTGLQEHIERSRHHRQPRTAALDTFTVTAVVTGPAGDTFLWQRREVCAEIADKIWQALGKPDTSHIVSTAQTHGEPGLHAQPDPPTIQGGAA